jgi:disulfide oxidoreductase YuzD
VLEDNTSCDIGLHFPTEHYALRTDVVGWLRPRFARRMFNNVGKLTYFQIKDDKNVKKSEMKMHVSVVEVILEILVPMHRVKIIIVGPHVVSTNDSSFRPSMPQFLLDDLNIPK